MNIHTFLSRHSFLLNWMFFNNLIIFLWNFNIGLMFLLGQGDKFVTKPSEFVIFSSNQGQIRSCRHPQTCRTSFERKTLNKVYKTYVKTAIDWCSGKVFGRYMSWSEKLRNVIVSEEKKIYLNGPNCYSCFWHYLSKHGASKIWYIIAKINST